MDALRTTSLVVLVAIATGAVVWTYAPRDAECKEPARTEQLEKLEQEIQFLNLRVDEAVRKLEQRRGRL